ncbi:hypothetical protein HY333_01695 [Candidatus Collierbacteria bacterium]|nr:hypothetical protein [Candidatus Collierbacteria bacterium]
MTARKKLVLGLLIVSLVLINIASLLRPRYSQAQTACDVDCLSAKIEALTKRVSVLEKQVNAKKTILTNAKQKEYFVSLSGGESNSGDWTSLSSSEFWFDLNLYAGVTQVTWEGWMENGYGLARLYDSTNFRAVDGSEVKLVSGVKTSFYSKPLSIWRGQNRYFIQVRSLNGTEVKISSARLKILSQ